MSGTGSHNILDNKPNRALAAKGVRRKRAHLFFALAALFIITTLGRELQKYSNMPNSKSSQANYLLGLGPHVSSDLVEGIIGSTNGETLYNTSIVPSTAVAGVSIKNDISPPLRTIKGLSRPKKQIVPDGRTDEGILDKYVPSGQIQRNDPVIQRLMGIQAMPTPIRNWNGITSQVAVSPPDTNGDVGPNHVVPIVNVTLQIWDKNGNSLYGPWWVPTVLFQGFGEPCEEEIDQGNDTLTTYNHYDPIALYDALADRWFVSFGYAVPFGNTPSGVCVAVSTTSDPLGSWYRYNFQLSTGSNDWHDYPKWGVWPDGYYLNTDTVETVRPFVFNRDSMLNGQPAAFQGFPPLQQPQGHILPSDLDGTTPPPPGSPNIYMERPRNESVRLWAFHVDWANPVNSSFSNIATIAVPAYNPLDSCGLRCIPQPNTSQKLDSMAFALMHRLAYRNFGDHDVLVFNHSVDGGSGQAGIRWYEVRNPRTSPTLTQVGTYAPDSANRWMGSIAMDQHGNLAIGYNVSSASIYPSIRYAGRLATDALGTLRSETTMIDGGGSQTGDYRWGDYSVIAVDPVDDCTFWVMAEYERVTTSIDWETRIGSFRFPSCNSDPTPVPPTATPTPCTLTFSDVPDTNTFYPNVRCLACRGIISGYADGTFRPNNLVTRGQLAKIVSNAANFIEDPEPQIFEDVPSSNTFYEWINRLARRGHMSGYACGGVGEPCTSGMPYFRPFANATRGQTSKIIANAAGYAEIPTDQTFEDVPPTHTFYREIQRLATRNIMQGYPCGGVGEPCLSGRPYFRPANNVTRGQSAKIVANTFYPGCDTP